MGIANKYNRGSKYTFQIPKEFSFASLYDLFNENGGDNIYTVRAFYINKKSRYGDHPVVATSNELIGLPKHLLDTVEEMMRDDECTEAINTEHLGFRITPYTMDDREYYSVVWIDI